VFCSFNCARHFATGRFDPSPQIKEYQVKSLTDLFAAGIALWVLVAGCKPSAIQQAEYNKQQFLRGIDAINGKNFEALNDLVTANFVRHCQATPDVKVSSLEDFKKYLRQDSATFPDSRLTIDHVVAEGDFVAFHGTYVGTQKGPMGPFPPSNRQMSLEIVGLQRIENGKLAEMWVTWDNLAALTQLGYFPPPTRQTK
jgi:predicted ester cyclase